MGKRFVFIVYKVIMKKIGIIPIKGPIASGSSMLPFSMDSVESIEESIRKAQKDGIDGLIVRIDSPGGSPYPSKKISEKIQNLDCPAVALIEEKGLSGAYWIASSCDKIIADELSKVGGIGAAAIQPDFSQLFDKLGVKMDMSSTGEYKDLGLPGTGENESEKNDLMKEQINEINEIFKEKISENRDIDQERTDEVFEGKPYLGKEAKEIGLIDELGGQDKAIEVLSKNWENEEIEVIDYENKIRKEKEGFLGGAVEKFLR